MCPCLNLRPHCLYPIPPHTRAHARTHTRAQVNRGLSELTMLYNKVRNEGALALVEAARTSRSPLLSLPLHPPPTRCSRVPLLLA